MLGMPLWVRCALKPEIQPADPYTNRFPVEPPEVEFFGPNYQFNIVVIGGGEGGLAASREAAKLGKTVLVVCDSQTPTCVVSLVGEKIRVSLFCALLSIIHIYLY